MMGHKLRIVPIFCTLVCLLGLRSTHPDRVFAQSGSDHDDDGNVYVFASIDYDSNGYLSVDSFTQLDYFADEDIELVDDEIQVDQDGSTFFDDYAQEDEFRSEYQTGSTQPVSTGHEYGVTSIGYACYADYEGDEEGGDCEFYPETSAYAAINVQGPPPRIASLDPTSVHEGDRGNLTVTGTNLVNYSGEQLTLSFSGQSNPFTLVGSPSDTSATFSYDFSDYPPGTYSLYVTNNEASSEPVSFTVQSPVPPVDPCAFGSNPQSGYSSLVSKGAAGGSGAVSVSFSDPAFSSFNPSVSYGPSSTPSSIAASMAALITRQYFQYGLSAKAFGPNVVYSGSTNLGTVNTSISGPSFAPDTSSGAASAVANACYAAPPQMPSAVISLKFTGNKDSQDLLIFQNAQGECSETLGVQDCPSPKNVWGWNLAGKVVVSDDAANWKVTQTYSRALFTYNYRDSRGNLESSKNDLCMPVGTCPGAPDGPLPGYLQQKSGNRTIFWIDGPHVSKTQLPTNASSLYSVDSGIMDDVFSVSVCSTRFPADCATKSWFVKLQIDPGSKLNGAKSGAGTQ